VILALCKGTRIVQWYKGTRLVNRYKGVGAVQRYIKTFEVQGYRSCTVCGYRSSTGV